MKKLTLFLLTVVMGLSLVACGNGNNKSQVDGGSQITTGPVYTVDVSELDPNIYPDDYPLIASSDFETAFEKLKDANVKAEINSYQDVVNIFGVDGAYYENCDVESGDQLYKYYGWYADDGVSVLITFKADGTNLEYFAYTGNGII